MMKWTKTPLVHVPPVTADEDPTVSITVGSTTTGAPGTSASVVNVGNNVDAIFNFTLPRGADGVAGDKGDKGDKGDRGEKGDKGDAGESGLDGISGTDGASAYAIALSNGFVGTESQWLSSLIGPAGEDGALVGFGNLDGGFSDSDYGGVNSIVAGEAE